MGPSPVTPRDSYELQLSQIWAGVLQRDGFGVTDDFFDLGGDGRTAGVVLAAVAAQLDTPLSMEVFLEEPTIENLACRLRARSRHPLDEAPVVALQPRGAKRPVFLLPSGEGNVFYFQALARRMAPDQPLYGLQLRGLHGDRPLLDRIEDMAAEHIESMRSMQPRGPYLLGGHCIGAMVALEMALQLQRRGERVALLASLDGLAPAVFYRDGVLAVPEDPVEFFVFLSRGFKLWLGRDVPLEREALFDLDLDWQAARFVDLAKQHGVYPPDATVERGLRLLELARRICRTPYEPADAFAGPITFFRARESLLCVTPTGGWDEVSARPLRVHELPGDHVTIVTEPYVDHLARELRAAIAEAGVS
jgi:thioesterase domain-containing protein